MPSFLQPTFKGLGLQSGSSATEPDEGIGTGTSDFPRMVGLGAGTIPYQGPQAPQPGEGQHKTTQWDKEVHDISTRASSLLVGNESHARRMGFLGIGSEDQNKTGMQGDPPFNPAGLSGAPGTQSGSRPIRIDLPSELEARLPVDRPLGSSPTQPSEETTAARSQAWSWALPGAKQSDIINMLRANQEDDMRRQLALKNDINKLSGGGPVTLQDLVPTNPKTWPEQAVAIKYIGHIQGVLGQGKVTDYGIFANNFPTVDKGLRGRAVDHQTRINILQKALQDANDQVHNMGWVPWAGRELLDLTFPWYGSFAISGETQGGLVLPGTGRVEDQNKIFMIPDPGDLMNVISEIGKRQGPYRHRDWLKNMIEHTSSDEFTGNWMSLVDIATSAGYGVAYKGARGIASMLRFGPIIGGGGVSPGVAASTAAGDLAAASLERATERGFRFKSEANDIIDGVYSHVDFRRQPFKGPDYPFMRHMSSEGVNRIDNILTNSWNKFKQQVADMVNVRRIEPALAVKEVMGLIQERIKAGSLFKGINNTILDISHPAYDIGTNSFSSHIFVGTENAELFYTEEQAKKAAEYYGYHPSLATVEKLEFDPYLHPSEAWKKDFAIMQQGSGYYIRLKVPLNEDMNVIRDARQLMAGSEDPKGVYTTFLGLFNAKKYVNPDEIISRHERFARKTTQYQPNNMMRAAVDLINDTMDLPVDKSISAKQRWKDFDKVMKSAAKDIDPATKKDGYWIKSPAELEHRWMLETGRLPDEQQMARYFAMQQLHEQDWVMRNMLQYSDIASHGNTQWAPRIVDPSTGKMIPGPFTNGVTVDRVPRDRNVGILVVNKADPSKSRAMRSDRMSPAEYKKWNRDVRDGKAKVIKRWNTDRPDFNGFYGVTENDRIHYVIASDFENKALEPVQVAYRGGGHLIFEHPYYLVQGRMAKDALTGNSVYEGDNTLFAIRRTPFGINAAKVLSEVIDHMKNGRMTEAQNLLTTKTQIEWDKWQEMFRPHRGPDGVLNQARLTLDHPIHMVPAGKQLIDTEQGAYLRTTKGIVDGTKSGNPSKQYRLAFTQERDAFDLHTLRDTGTKRDPYFAMEPADHLNPMQSIARAMNKVTSSLFMDPYKRMAIENWLAQGLKAGAFKYSPDQIYSAPYHYFHDSEIFAAGISKELQGTMEARRYAIRNLTGLPSETESVTHSIAQKLSDMVYEKLGPKFGDRLLSVWEAGKTRDATRFMRSMVFNMKLGLFNPGMYLLHASTGINAIAIAGLRSGLAGTAASLMHFYSSFNKSPEIIAHMDKILSYLGWKPGQYTEVRSLIDKSGFLHENGTYAMHEAALNNEFIKSDGKKFLDMSLMFFKGGLKAMRTVAFYAAYHEFRNAGAGKLGRIAGRIGVPEMQQIVERADILAHNMTRASNSAMQTNWWSKMPLQFHTYFSRLAELTVGNRLTGAEKMRLIGTNAMLYGLPAATGLVSFYPFEQSMRQKAIEHGYVPGQSFIKDTLMNGTMSSMIGWATGEHYDIAGRLGPKGMLEFLGQDRSYWSIATGAVGSEIESALTSLNPFTQAVVSMWDGSSQSPRWDLRPEQILTTFKDITSVNAAANMYTGVKYGQWFAKKDSYGSGQPIQDNLGVFQSIMMAVTGLRTQQMNDLYLRRQSEKELQSQYDHYSSKYREYFTKHLQAIGNNDPEQADDYAQQAEAYRILMPLKDQIEALRILNRYRDETQISREDQSYYNLRRFTPDKQDQMEDARQAEEAQE